MTLKTESLFDDPTWIDHDANEKVVKKDPTHVLHHGDCLEVMKTMDADTFTAVVTDPPAGIAFMGKEWDKDKGGRDSWIAWMTTVAAEALRVCKPGAHALVWALPRTSHWTATAWEDAGWECREVIHFLHGVGFPKALSIDKALDKKAGAVREVVGSKKCSSGTGEAFGKAVGYKGGEVDVDITAPSTPDAKTWAGYATALKPAVEHWWLLRKPIERGLSIAENCVKHGAGALNIEGSRVGTEELPSSIRGVSRIGTFEGADGNVTPQRTGRFPANLAHDSSDTVLAEFAKAGTSKSIPGEINAGDFGKHGAYNAAAGCVTHGYSDEGSPARFFTSCPAESGDYPPFWYGAKAGRKEKEKGLEGEEKKQLHTCFAQDEWTKAHMGNTPTNEMKPVANSHPTIKSLSLMRWLCGLVKMPEHNLILDPFCGTCSTIIACKQLGIDAVGIEKEAEYVKIGKLRMKANTCTMKS